MAMSIIPTMPEYEPGYKDIDLGPTLAVWRNTPRDEYSNMNRFELRDHPNIPWTHQLVRDSEPLHVRQHCRTMTLAQGRILYQIYDDYEPWNPRHCGFIVPSFIVAEAYRISVNDRKDDWKCCDPTQICRYEDTWDAVVEAWPRIPVFGARRVVEELAGSRLGAGKAGVDEAVVRFARRYWTSYKARLDAKGVSEWDTRSNWKVVKEIEEQVAGRLREVLNRWTEPGVGLATNFLEKHGLVDGPVKSPVQSTSQDSAQSPVKFRRFS